MLSNLLDTELTTLSLRVEQELYSVVDVGLTYAFHTCATKKNSLVCNEYPTLVSTPL